MNEEPEVEVPEEPCIDTPSLEQRVSQLESQQEELIRDFEALKNLSHQHVPKRAGVPQRNCQKCGRLLVVPPGNPCPFCGASC